MGTKGCVKDYDLYIAVILTYNLDQLLFHFWNLSFAIDLIIYLRFIKDNLRQQCFKNTCMV